MAVKSFQLPDCGRTAIVHVRIAGAVVRVQIARGAIAVIAVAAKTNTHYHPSLLSTFLLGFRGHGPYARLVSARKDFLISKIQKFRGIGLAGLFLTTAS